MELTLGLVWAILAAVVGTFALGFLWYGPLFGKPWMRAMGWEGKSKAEMEEVMRTSSPTPGYLVSLAGAILATFLLWILYGWAKVGASYEGPMLGMALASAGWLAFYLPGTLTSRFFESRDWTLTWIGALYFLAAALIQGAAVGFFAP